MGTWLGWMFIDSNTVFAQDWGAVSTWSWTPICQASLDKTTMSLEDMICTVEKQQIKLLDRETEIQMWAAKVEMSMAKQYKIEAELQDGLSNLKRQEENLEKLRNEQCCESSRLRDKAAELENCENELQMVKQEVAARAQAVEVLANKKNCLGSSKFGVHLILKRT